MEDWPGLKITRVNENVMVLKSYASDPKYIDELEPVFMTVRDILSSFNLEACLRRFDNHIIMVVIAEEEILNRTQKKIGKLLIDTLREAGYTEDEIKQIKKKISKFLMEEGE